MSKVADKMRGRLASIQKDREQFERQRKELENEMNIGRQNMGKIQKGLKNNLILEDPIVLTETPALSEPSPSMPRKQSRRENGKIVTNSQFSSLNMPMPTEANSPAPTNNNPVIPPGTRISDWCYTGPIDSAPPTVKSRELYENIRLLGRGSFGEVNLAKNIDDSKLFAIKTIFCSRDYEYDLTLKEICFLRSNRHPYIIDVLDAFTTTNPRIVHIVMHYCESGTLSTVISGARKNKSTLPEAQIIKWVLQLALAMHHLHENHTLHRDLKPMNVMLTEGGELLKLADFGLAINMDKNSEEQQNEAGTPYYTAPEIIRAENYSYPADCWSFGIIMFQMLQLERPFEGTNTSELVKSILQDEPPQITTHYSEDLKTICLDLLLKNQEKRLSMHGLLNHPFLVNKLTNFPNSYRPKNLDDRVRRQQIRQLETQIDTLTKFNPAMTSRRSSNVALTPGNPMAGKFSRGNSFRISSSFESSNNPLNMSNGPTTNNSTHSSMDLGAPSPDKENSSYKSLNDEEELVELITNPQNLSTFVIPEATIEHSESLSPRDDKHKHILIHNVQPHSSFLQIQTEPAGHDGPTIDFTGTLEISPAPIVHINTQQRQANYQSRHNSVDMGFMKDGVNLLSPNGLLRQASKDQINLHGHTHDHVHSSPSRHGSIQLSQEEAEKNLNSLPDGHTRSHGKIPSHNHAHQHDHKSPNKTTHKDLHSDILASTSDSLPANLTNPASLSATNQISEDASNIPASVPTLVISSDDNGIQPSIVSGRKHIAITQAIANDQEYEKQLIENVNENSPKE